MAKKRYHESETATMSERRKGDYDYKKGSNEIYADLGPARWKAVQDQEGGMIMENPRAIANLPQEVMIKPYPMTRPSMPAGLNDTIDGIDSQMDYDDSQRSRQTFPRKA